GRHRHGRLVAEHHLRARVAYEHHVDPGALGRPRRREVVGGDHDDLLAGLLHLRETGRRDGGGVGGHGSLPGRVCSIVLSMRRTSPARAATTASACPDSRAISSRLSGSTIDTYSTTSPALSSAARA